MNIDTGEKEEKGGGLSPKNVEKTGQIEKLIKQSPPRPPDTFDILTVTDEIESIEYGALVGTSSRASTMKFSAAIVSASLAGIASATVQGFDISAYQTDVDFSGAYSSGARFVIIKVWSPFHFPPPPFHLSALSGICMVHQLSSWA